MKKLKPKKFLGQHFLNNEEVSIRIIKKIDITNIETIIEVGPGMGVLSRHIIKLKKKLVFVEIDSDAVNYLKDAYRGISDHIINQDFLKLDIQKFKSPIAIVGNFPYNISSQIVFKIIENRNSVSQMVGMFQKEVAQRICSKPGSKVYGILSVLTQAFFSTNFLFSLKPSFFDPPPKVESSVVEFSRNQTKKLKCNEDLFFIIVKKSFQQRRKTLKNSLKTFNLSKILKEDVIFEKRPETLSIEDFVLLTNIIENGTVPTFRRINK